MRDNRNSIHCTHQIIRVLLHEFLTVVLIPSHLDECLIYRQDLDIFKPTLVNKGLEFLCQDLSVSPSYLYTSYVPVSTDLPEIRGSP